MDPQLLIPSPAADFHFDSTPTSPYASAPSSPKMFFPRSLYVAPATSSISLTNPDTADDFQTTDPFVSCDEIHEQKNEYSNEDGTDFAFDFSGQLEGPLISAADELFDSGRIKPLEPPPPPLQSPIEPLRSSISSPRSYNKKNYLEPFSETLHQTPKDQSQNPSPLGRETTTTTTTTRHRASRSLSPSRVPDVLSQVQKVSTTQSSSPFGFIWCNKWNLKNLLLFRSTSEGSATTINDPLKKYAMITKGDQDVNNSSFRSSDGGCSVGGSSRRRMKRKVSAHEIHYTANRAAAEERRRKTFLPYKSGLLGCLGFHHNLHEASSRGR